MFVALLAATCVPALAALLAELGTAWTCHMVASRIKLHQTIAIIASLPLILPRGLKHHLQRFIFRTITIVLRTLTNRTRNRLANLTCCLLLNHILIPDERGTERRRAIRAIRGGELDFLR